MTPLLWPVENGEWRMGITRELACGKNLSFVHTLGHFGVFNTNEMQKVAWCINLRSEKTKLCGNTFAQEVFAILRPPPFKENVRRPHYAKIENVKKEV